MESPSEQYRLYRERLSTCPLQLNSRLRATYRRIQAQHWKMRYPLLISLAEELADLADLPTAKLHHDLALPDDLDGIQQFLSLNQIVICRLIEDREPIEPGCDDYEDDEAGDDSEEPEDEQDDESTISDGGDEQDAEHEEESEFDANQADQAEQEEMDAAGTAVDITTLSPHTNALRTDSNAFVNIVLDVLHERNRKTIRCPLYTMGTRATTEENKKIWDACWADSMPLHYMADAARGLNDAFGETVYNSTGRTAESGKTTCLICSWNPSNTAE
jgi:hypothetical protein